MTKLWLAAAVAAFLFTPVAFGPAQAEDSSKVRVAPVNEVIAECDAMIEDSDPDDCGYDVGDNGLYGCSTDGGGNIDTCFFCPADGSRSCFLFMKGRIPDRFRHEFADLGTIRGFDPQPDPPAPSGGSLSGPSDGISAGTPKAAAPVLL